LCHRLPAVGLLFVLTGAVALVAEQVFERLLSTVVGASTPAGTIVLAVYFCGLTAGGLLYPAFTARLRRPLLLYGLLEGFVGLWALGLTPSCMPVMPWSTCSTLDRSRLWNGISRSFSGTNR